MRLKVTITPTADGKQDYMQAISDDMVSVNVVLIADYIELHSARHQEEQVAWSKAIDQLRRQKKELESRTEVLGRELLEARSEVDVLEDKLVALKEFYTERNE